MSWVKPKPLVKRRHCFEIDERIDRRRQGRHAARRGTDPNRRREIAALPEDQAVAVMLSVLLSQSGA